MAVINKPNKEATGLSRALGLTQAGAGIFFAPETGGLSLLGVPAGLSGAQGGTNPVLEMAGGLGNTVGFGMDIKGKLDNKSAAEEMSPKNMAKESNRLEQSSLQRRMASTKPQITNDQAAHYMKFAEMDLNDMRQTNPELASKISPVFFETAQKFSKLYKSGKSIFDDQNVNGTGEYDATNYNA